MNRRPSIEIAENTWLISEFALVNSYLLIGSQSCLLIDCGLGIGNLLEDVQLITDKPLQVVLTHGHFDHIGGSALFPSVKLPSEDHPQFKYWYQQLVDTDLLEKYILTRLPVRSPETDPNELLMMNTHFGEYHLQTLQNSQFIDLGNRKIEVIHTPGHTIGSVCFLDEESKILFTGDMCNEESLLLNFDDFSASVKTYNESMRKLWNRKQEYNFLGLGHSPMMLGNKSLIPEYIRATDELLAGKVSIVESSDTMHSGYQFRSNNILIWYDPNKIQ